MKRLSTMTADTLAALPVGARFELRGTVPAYLVKTDPDEWRWWSGDTMTSAELAVEIASLPPTFVARWTLTGDPATNEEAP